MKTIDFICKNCPYVTEEDDSACDFCHRDGSPFADYAEDERHQL